MVHGRTTSHNFDKKILDLVWLQQFERNNEPKGIQSINNNIYNIPTFSIDTMIKHFTFQEREVE